MRQLSRRPVERSLGTRRSSNSGDREEMSVNNDISLELRGANRGSGGLAGYASMVVGLEDDRYSKSLQSTGNGNA